MPSYGSGVGAYPDPPPGLPPGPNPPPHPPPGPGVYPPFVAPPTDGTRQRRWLALALAGGAVLVLCVGGVSGLAALLVSGSQMIVDESRAAVTNYLTAVRDGEYEAAYDQLCPAERSRQSSDQFVRTLARQPQIVSFTVADPNVTSDRVVVPATISYEGNSVTVRYVLEQDTSTGDFEVCGREG